MATDTAEATMNFSSETKTFGDQIANLTLLKAKELSDYLEHVHGIKPAAGGVMMAGPAGGGEAAPAVEEKTEFDVVLKAAGGNKIAVIKVVRAATALGLKEAKDLVDSAPKAIKTGISKEDADKLLKEITDAGGEAELK